MKVIIRSHANGASEYAAQYIIDRINEFSPTPERPFILGLPTGSSPEAIYRHLVSAHKANQVSFANVKTFNMDEYVNLPQDHPESYHSFMYKHFFAHIDINPANVHILNGNAEDLETECAEYERKITEAGGIDLFLGGIGPDGHIAFNEPGSSLRSRTRVATLAEDTIRANSRFFGGDLSKVPKQALTVGVQTIMDAREVMLIVTGAHKAMALSKTIEGSVSQMWTASCLQMHEHAVIVCDDAATDEMLVKTVKYFKSVEEVASRTWSLQQQQQQQQRRRKSSLPLTPPPSASKPRGTNAKSFRDGLKELRIDTDKIRQKAVDAEDGELTPDSMSSRIMGDSALGLNDPKMDDFVFDRMSSRVSTFAS